MTKKRDISELPLEEQKRILGKRAANAKYRAAHCEKERARDRERKNAEYRADPTTALQKNKTNLARRRSEDPEGVLKQSRKYQKAFYDKDPQAYRAKAIKYARSHREKDLLGFRVRANARYKRKCLENLNFKISVRLRNRLYHALKNHSKEGSAIGDLGCSIEEFRSYIEAQFQPGMTWENHTQRGWHLDHRIPLDHFDLSDREQFLKACHYTNYQPMWAANNWSKNNRWADPLGPLLPHHDNDDDRFSAVA